MTECIKRPNVGNLDAAVRLYYEKFELSSDDIKQIFGAKSSSSVARLKKLAREAAVKAGRMPWDAHCVPTDVAYEAWGLEIADLEKRRAKLMKICEVK